MPSPEPNAPTALDPLTRQRLDEGAPLSAEQVALVNATLRRMAHWVWDMRTAAAREGRTQ